MPFQPEPPDYDQARYDVINNALDTAIAEIQNDNINLTKEERRKGQTVGKKRLPMVLGYWERKNDYPTLKPQFMDEVAADKHFVVAGKFSPIIEKGMRFIEMAVDLQLNSEKFTMDYTNEGKNSSKRGKDKNVPGADTLWDFFSDFGRHTSGSTGDDGEGSGEEGGE